MDLRDFKAFIVPSIRSTAKEILSRGSAMNPIPSFANKGVISKLLESSLLVPIKLKEGKED